MRDLLRKNTVRFYKESINKIKVGGETGKQNQAKKFPKTKTIGIGNNPKTTCAGSNEEWK